MGNKCTEEGMLKVLDTPSWAETSDWRRGGGEVFCPVFFPLWFSIYANLHSNQALIDVQ